MADPNAIGGSLVGSLGLGKFSFGTGTLSTIFIWIFLGIIVCSLIGGVFIWYYLKRVWNQKSWIFGKVGGVPMLKAIYPSRYVKLGAVGDRLFEISKLKKFIASPTIQMGKNIWWFWEREDGEIINIGLKDIDEHMRRIGAYFMETDVRMVRLGIEKNLKDRFDEKSFWSKYLSTIAGVIFVVLVTVALVVLFTKLVDVAESIDNLAKSVSSMAGEVKEFYSDTNKQTPNNKPQNGTSGLVPALIFFYIYPRRRNLYEKLYKYKSSQ